MEGVRSVNVKRHSGSVIRRSVVNVMLGMSLFMVSEIILTRVNVQWGHSRYYSHTRMCLGWSIILCTGIKGYSCANVSLQKGNVKVGFRCTALVLDNFRPYGYKVIGSESGGVWPWCIRHAVYQEGRIHRG